MRRLLAFSLLALPLASAFALEPPASFDSAAQDGSGVVWAASAKEHLFTFDGKEWSAPTAPFAAEDAAAPASLARTPDGSVECVWSLSGDRIGVTRQSGTGSRLLGECPGKIDGLKSPPFADSRNRLWITGGSPEIYRADPEGKVALVYTIKQEQRIDQADPAWHFGEVLACEDGKGRVWVWSDSWAGTLKGTAVRGVLLFDGTNVTQQEKFQGVTNPRFSFIGRKDASHMWLASMKEGVFSVDIDTFKAEPLAEPELGAFLWVKKVFSSGDDLFVVASPAGEITKNALWCQRAGNWTRVIDNLDARFNAAFDYGRPWLRIGKQTVVCAYAGTPWLIPDNSAPARLDPQSAIQDAGQLFSLPDGSLFALNSRGNPLHAASLETLSSTPLAPPPSKQPPERVIELNIAPRLWTVDSGGTAWTVFQRDDTALEQWGGAGWQRYPFPDDVHAGRFLGAFADTRGRIWLLPNQIDGEGIFFDSHYGKWQRYPNMEAAFAALKDDLPNFVGDPPRFLAPASSADKQRIAFLGETWVLSYFDGKTWQHWKRADIEGQPNGSFALDQPFFDKDGHLSVQIQNAIWQLNGQGHWQSTTGEPAPRPGHQRIPPPEGAVTNSPESWAVDNQGAYWLTWQGGLYKCAYGKCVPVLSGSDGNLFADRRRITRAWVDRYGTAFFETGYLKRVMINPKSPLPHATVAITKVVEDAVTARLGSDAPRAGFRWQLDGGEWHMTKDESLVLDSLPRGAHTLTALAFNDDLETGGPSEAKFEINVDPAKQLADLIKKLDDPDFASREKAVAALGRQPATAALPALKAARDKSDDDQRWWIDAAIQEVERKAAK